MLCRSKDTEKRTKAVNACVPSDAADRQDVVDFCRHERDHRIGLERRFATPPTFGNISKALLGSGWEVTMTPTRTVVGEEQCL